MKKFMIMLTLIALAVIVTACTASSNPSTPTGNVVGNAPNNAAPVNTPAANPAPINPTPTNTVPDAPARIRLVDSRFANFSYLISGDSLDAAAQQAISGFNIVKTQNPDGTATINLSSTNPEYKNQSYTLQQGQQLYFIERILGDDTNNEEHDLRDDTAIVVDSEGYIISGYTPPRDSGNNTQGFRGNLTDAERQQFMQQRLDACSGLTENDPCTLNNTRGEMNGTCVALNSTLQCMVRFNRSGGG